eukprot:6077136-Lingulodinium_polyedra.AAC.1
MASERCPQPPRPASHHCCQTTSAVKASRRPACKRTSKHSKKSCCPRVRKAGCASQRPCQTSPGCKGASPGWPSTSRAR